MTATVARVSPNPKRTLQDEDETRILNALTAYEDSAKELRAAVLEAAEHGASVRVLADFTGMSTNTISRWKREGRD